MTTKYIGKTGASLGQADDEITIMADTVEEALRKLLGYSEAQWPESDSSYDAVVWIENENGEVLTSEDVEIAADGHKI